jgi:hypothetical protein
MISVSEAAVARTSSTAQFENVRRTNSPGKGWKLEPSVWAMATLGAS